VRKSKLAPDYSLIVLRVLTCVAVIKMITGRLASVTKKQQMIVEANSKEQQAQLQAARRRSGDVTPRSIPSHGST